ncbi:MAG: phage tail tape measure protein [Candidatus Methanospirareceae archaeon]
MSMGHDVSVRVVLKGIDQASPSIRKVSRSFKTLRGEAQAVSRDLIKSFQNIKQFSGTIQSPLRFSEGLMRKMRNEVNKVAITVPKANKQFRLFGVTLRTLSAGIQSVIGGLIGFTIINKIASSVHDAVKEFLYLEKRLTALAVVSREAGESIRDLSERYMQAAIDAAERYGVSIVESAEALDSLVRAGLSGSEAIRALNSVLEIAISEGTDASQVADILASTLFQFGLNAQEAERAADALVNAAAVGVSTMTEYANGLSYVGAVAKQLGFNLEETLAALVMVDASIKDATKSGRYLQAALSNMAQKADKLGFSIYDANGKMLSMEEIFKRLYRRLQEFGSEQERNQYLFQIFGEQGARAVAAIITYFDKAIREGKTLDEVFKSLYDRIREQGTAIKVAGEVMATTAGSVMVLNTKIEKLNLSFARLFATLSPVIDRLGDFTDKIDITLRTIQGLPLTLEEARKVFVNTFSVPIPRWMENWFPSIKNWNTFVREAAENSDNFGKSLEETGKKGDDVKQFIEEISKAYRKFTEETENAAQQNVNMAESIEAVAREYGLTGEQLAEIMRETLGLNVIYDEHEIKLEKLMNALGLTREQAERLLPILEEQKNKTDNLTQSNDRLARSIESANESLRNSIEQILNYGRATGPFTSALKNAKEAIDKLKEAGQTVPKAFESALETIDDLNEKIIELKTQAESFSITGNVADVGESFIDLQRSFREAEITPKIRELEREIEELKQKEEEIRETIGMNKSLKESMIEQLEREIREREKQIEALKKSIEGSELEQRTLENLKIIQKTLSFQTQVLSLYQEGLRLAMLGATEAGKGMMQAAMDLASALEDGIVTDEEKKKVLEDLGVTFDETGKPVLNLKDIMQKFEEQVKENMEKINEFRDTLQSLDGLTAHTYHYHHEITIHEEKRVGSRHTGGITIREGEQAAPGLQTGAWYVREGLYYLHRGEMVLPKNVAEWFRRGGAGIGSQIINVHVNINASGVSDPRELADIVSREIVRRLRVMAA